MVDWFDDKGFEQYYLSSAKAKNKNGLLVDFSEHGLITGDPTAVSGHRQEAGSKVHGKIQNAKSS